MTGVTLDLGICFGPKCFAIKDFDVTARNPDEPFGLETTEVPGDDFADGAEADGQLLLSFRHGEGIAGCKVGEIEERLGEALADVAESNAFDEVDEGTQALAEDFEETQGEVRIASAERLEVGTQDQQGFSGLYRDDGGGIVPTIKDRDFGDGGGSALSGEDDLTSSGCGLQDFDGTFGDHMNSRAGGAFVEESLPGIVLLGDGHAGQRVEFRWFQAAERLNQREDSDLWMRQSDLIFPHRPFRRSAPLAVMAFDPIGIAVLEQVGDPNALCGGMPGGAIFRNAELKCLRPPAEPGPSPASVVLLRSDGSLDPARPDQIGMSGIEDEGDALKVHVGDAEVEGGFASGAFAQMADEPVDFRRRAMEPAVEAPCEDLMGEATVPHAIGGVQVGLFRRRQRHAVRSHRPEEPALVVEQAAEFAGVGIDEGFRGIDHAVPGGVPLTGGEVGTDEGGVSVFARKLVAVDEHVEERRISKEFFQALAMNGRVRHVLGQEPVTPGVAGAVQLLLELGAGPLREAEVVVEGEGAEDEDDQG